MVPSSRPRPPMQTLDLMMKLVVIFALSWFLYVSFINRPSLPTPELQSAARLLKAGNTASAHTQFDRFLAARPTSAAAYVQVCLYCQEAHRFDLMAEYAQRGTHACANADSADRAQLYAKLAIALSESGKAQALPARAAARQAQVLAPDDPVVLNEAGYVLADTTADVADLTDSEKRRTAIADLKDAEKMIARALTTLSNGAGAEDPSGFLATVEDSYGWVLYKQGLVGPSVYAPEAFARAVTALLQSAADLPADADPEAAKIVYYHLGAAYHQVGQLDAARDAIAESLRYDPHYADALAEQRSLVLASQALHPVPPSPATAHAFTPLQSSSSKSQIKL